MKFLYCVAFVIFAIFFTEIEADDKKKDCFDWKKMKSQLIEGCEECKKNYTTKEDIKECFEDMEFEADEDDNLKKDEYVRDYMDEFTGTEEAKKNVENGLKECVKNGTKTDDEYKEVDKCTWNVLKTHCPEAEKYGKEFEDCEELKDCQ